MEVRAAGLKTAKSRNFELADICPLAGYKSLSRVGGLDCLSGCVVAKRIKRQVWRAARAIGCAGIDEQPRGMAADIGSVVTGGAGSHNYWTPHQIVEARDIRDLDWLRIEDDFAARHGLAICILVLSGPSSIHVHRVRIEWSAAGIVAKNIIYSKIKRLRR